MSKPITYEDFADFEIQQRLATDSKNAKQLICVVNVILEEIHFEVVCPGVSISFPGRGYF